MKRWTTLALAATLAIVGTGCADREAQKQAKETAAVVTDPTVEVEAKLASTKDLQETIMVTGDVTTTTDSEIGPKASGRVTQVLVSDGDSVSAGQVIAQMDTATLSAQLNQAVAQELGARGSLSQAQAGLTQALRNQAINPSKSRAAIRSAESQLRSAQAALQKQLAGARPQERVQAEANVASAKANLETQRKQLERIRNLVQQGAVAGSELDAQQATFEAARTQYENAVQSLNLIREGNRSEDITAAREAVKTAQEQVTTAKANRDLDTLYTDQVNSAKAQVASAKAQVEASAAQVEVARQNLADATIRAPFSGTVSGRPVQPGTVVGPGTAILRLVGTQGIYFEGSIPSAQVNTIREGQTVTISIDALSGRTFPGVIRNVGNLGSSVGRLFTARIAFTGAPAEVKPGMFARGTIVTRTVTGATVVPNTAVLKDEQGAYVMVAEGASAKKVRVQAGLTQEGVTQITGLPASAQVIVRGQNDLREGTKIKVVKEASA